MSNEIQPMDDEIQNMLRGHHAIAQLRDELDLRGFRVPDDYLFKVMDKSAISAANSAVFSLLVVCRLFCFGLLRTLISFIQYL